MSKNPFRKIYVWLYVMSRLAGKELKSGKKISLSKKLWCWSKGFFSSSYVLYGLDKNDYRLYLSDYQENIKAIRLNDGYSEILDNKIKFSDLIRKYLNVPNELATLDNGMIKPLINDFDTASDIFTILNSVPVLIFKPIDSAAGMGVIRVKLNNNKVEYNSETITKEVFKERLNNLNNYIISTYIEQAEYSKKIFPRTVNTIRIITMISQDDKSPFITAAAHRFGTDKSFPVDNCNAGGLTANIDVESGVLGSAVLTYFNGNDLKWMDRHPDSGEVIKGVEIPGWNEIRTGILDTASKISHLKYIGWDIVLTSKGFLVLEGNNGPDIKLHQVHKPLLSDQRNMAFFKYYKVVN